MDSHRIIGQLDITGKIYRFLNGVRYAGGLFVPLAAPLTSTDWNGDARSTTGKTLLDLSAVFGAPAGIKAALFKVVMNDSGSATNDIAFWLGPTNGDMVGPALYAPYGLTNDKGVAGELIVPCDANGDVYFQNLASGAGTQDITLEIWGYWV